MKIKTRRYYIYYLLRVLFFMLRLVPRRVGLFLAKGLGEAAFKYMGKYRDIALANLDAALGPDEKRNTRIAREVFRNLARNGVEWLKMMSISKKDLLSLVAEIEGLDRLEKALQEGKGVIVVASHFGNWELMPIYLRAMGYKGAVIARRIYFDRYDKLICSLRNKFGPIVIYRDESPKKILKVLRGNGIMGILADQDIRDVENVFISFFGMPAATPVAPVKLAFASGAALMPWFMLRRADGRYKLIIEEAIPVAQGPDKDEDVRRYTQAWTDVLERYIRQYPEQWVWIHERWKTKEPVTAS